jgi:hypothetical protein
VSKADLAFDPPELRGIQCALHLGESGVPNDQVVAHDAQLKQRADDGEHASRAVGQGSCTHELRRVGGRVTLMDLHHPPLREDTMRDLGEE